MSVGGDGQAIGAAPRVRYGRPRLLCRLGFHAWQWLFVKPGIGYYQHPEPRRVCRHCQAHD